MLRWAGHLTISENFRYLYTGTVNLSNVNFSTLKQVAQSLELAELSGFLSKFETVQSPPIGDITVISSEVRAWFQLFLLIII